MERQDKKIIKSVQHDIPGNIGRMNDPDGSAVVRGQCGDTMEMYLAIDGEMIGETLFFTDGCGSSTACGSTAARLASGKPIREALWISPAEVLDLLGDVPVEDVHCAILAVMTLYKAIADYLLRYRQT